MRALVTGACGQDGVLLRRLLVSHDVEVLGLDRNGAVEGTDGGGEVTAVDITDEPSVLRILADFRPDQIYHLAACHHSSERVGSAALDREMLATNFHAAENLIGYIADRLHTSRILLAGSSQMYCASDGQRLTVSESTPMNPSSFYGQTKAWARELLSYYRNQRGVFGSTVILFNHESVRRSPEFVTRKITMAAARAKCGHRVSLHLRDIDSEIDWSSAVDVVEGMRLALSAPEPRDYVLASGTVHRIEDVLDIAFGFVQLDWRQLTTCDPPNGRQSRSLVGDSSLIRQSLGWRPSVTFSEMIEEMVRFDLQLLQTAAL